MRKTAPFQKHAVHFLCVIHKCTDFYELHFYSLKDSVLFSPKALILFSAAGSSDNILKALNQKIQSTVDQSFIPWLISVYKWERRGARWWDIRYRSRPCVAFYWISAWQDGKAAERPASSHAGKGNISYRAALSSAPWEIDKSAGSSKHIKIQSHYPFTCVNRIATVTKKNRVLN